MRNEERAIMLYRRSARGPLKRRLHQNPSVPRLGLGILTLLLVLEFLLPEPLILLLHLEGIGVEVGERVLLLGLQYTLKFFHSSLEIFTLIICSSDVVCLSLFQSATVTQSHRHARGKHTTRLKVLSYEKIGF